MPIRRAADPLNVQHVLDAIRSASHGHQTADSKRLVKYLQKIDDCSVAQAELYIQQTVHDGFISTVQKSSVRGDQPETYKVTAQELPELDGNDWYCFECHLAGNVTTCKTCFRVFHADCATSAAKRKFDDFKKTGAYKPKRMSFTACLDTSAGAAPNNSDGDRSNRAFDSALCSVCNIARVDEDCTNDVSELNYLLKFVVNRIQSWLPKSITHTMAVEERPEWQSDKELTWRANHLFFEHRDMSVIEVKVNSDSYSHIHEFLADVLTIQHNVAIFHGTDSQEYGASELMVRDCVHDLGEMKLCVDCYRHSNEKLNPRWFCLPCRVPHELVWAKQKGYPHWPAKVIRETNTHCDVRFFGGKYERSLLAKTFIKPIKTPKEKLHVKLSTAYNKSVEELHYHQRLLDNPVELKALIDSSTPSPKTMGARHSFGGIPSTAARVSLAKTTAKPARKRNSSSASSSAPVSSPTPNDSASAKIDSAAVGGNSNSGDDIDLIAAEVAATATAPPAQTDVGKNQRSKRKSSRSTEEPTPMKRRISGQSAAATVNNEESNVSEILESPPSEEQKTKNSTSVVVPNSGENNVIAISDGEEEETEFSFRRNYAVGGGLDNYDQVTSSTETYKDLKVLEPMVVAPVVVSNANGMQTLDHPYSDSVEKMRRKLETLTDKREIIKCAMECMQVEVDRITNENNDHLKRLFESHNAQISETKKKQWCFNCEQDAIYHCCWNTAYCSQSCQQQHWQAEHKKVCRRKR